MSKCFKNGRASDMKKAIKVVRKLEEKDAEVVLNRMERERIEIRGFC